MMKIWVLLPAFNEEKSIPRVFPKIREVLTQRGFEYEIVVCEDGSNDSTCETLRAVSADYPLRVIAHVINRGLGETERDLFEYVAMNGHEDDVAIRFDCDDTHDPKYILDMIDKLAEGYDVVNTSRFQPGGGQEGVDGYRAFISYCANVFMRIVFNIRGVRDYSCGYRAYRVQVLKDAVTIFGNSFIQLRGLGFTSTLETLVKLKIMGCYFSEVPFVLRYDKKASPSKMISSLTMLGYFTMATLYHWPFGGWKRFYKNLGPLYRKSNHEACKNFSEVSMPRNSVCRIGG